MKAPYTLAEANAVLPLVRAIAAEILERRALRRKLRRQRKELETASTPEGVTWALSDLDARIYEQDEGIHMARLELEDYGLRVLRLNPLTVHFPGKSRNGRLVFCWQEKEDAVCFGHPEGDEEEHRRPLRLRAS